MSPKSTPIPFDRLSAPAQRALTGAGYKTLQQLAKVRESDLAKLHGLGPGTLVVLRRELAANGLAFKKD